MTWAKVKDDLRHAAPFLTSGLDLAGPWGVLAGSLVSAALGVNAEPDSVSAALARDPQAIEKVRLAEINNHAAIQQAMIENANLQAETNAAGAAHPWLIGWRALIGYDCALALTWQWIVLPVAQFFLALAGLHPVLPQFDLTQLMVILSGMLGLAGWHVADGVRFAKGNARGGGAKSAPGSIGAADFGASP